MGVYERLNRIDEFFKKLSILEFEQVLIRSGIEEIKSASDFDMEMLLEIKGNSYTTNGMYNKESNNAYNEYKPNETLAGAA